jgi:hypothetical protein
LNSRVLGLLLGLSAIATLISCGGSSGNKPPSGLTTRVLAAQSVTSTNAFGGLVIVNGATDTLPPHVAALSAGTSPDLLAISPTRNIVVAFDQGSNSLYAVQTSNESSMGIVRLPGPTWSFVVPTPQPTAYAAVPTATVNGYSFVGGVEVANLSPGGIVTTIGVTNAQTVVSNESGSVLLVFSNDSDAVTVLSPGSALPVVDTSCFNAPPNAVCTILSSGFSRPVYGIISGGTAYILNCGFQCGGSQQASVAILNLSSLTITNTIPVNGATYALLSGSSLYVAGLGTPTGPLCTSIPSAAPTAATYCGTLDIVDLNTMTDPYYNNPSMEIAITDGYHQRMDMSLNGQLFIGSWDCTNIGNANYPSGEVRGCLAIYNTETGAVVVPPDNGDVGGLQSFTTRYVEYVAEGGNLRVYDTTKDILLINDTLTAGTIPIVGYVADIKAIDFF